MTHDLEVLNVARLDGGLDTPRDPLGWMRSRYTAWWTPLAGNHESSPATRTGRSLGDCPFGSFDDEAAVVAYNRVALHLLGPAVKLNFPGARHASRYAGRDETRNII